MSKASQFPWDLLKAECLRLVCAQLAQGSKEGGNYPGASRKEDMIEFIRDVEKRGLEPAIKQAEQLAEETRAATMAARPDSPPTKRKSSRLEDQNEEEEVHNTRFKGTKRVKLSKDESTSIDSVKPTPKRGRPRKSAAEAPASETDAPATASTSVKKRGRPRKNPEDGGSASVALKPKVKKAEKATNTTSDGVKRGRGRPRKSLVEEDGKEKKEERKTEQDGEEKPKRGRGRPRKSVNNEPTSSAPPSKSAKPVFDGVLLKKRKSDQHEGSVNGDADADADAEGVDEDINEVQAVLAAPNGQTNEDSPSQTESNKENEPNVVTAPVPLTDDQGADADADGELDAEVQPTAAVVA